MAEPESHASQSRLRAVVPQGITALCILHVAHAPLLRGTAVSCTTEFYAQGSAEALAHLCPYHDKGVVTHKARLGFAGKFSRLDRDSWVHRQSRNEIMI